MTDAEFTLAVAAPIVGVALLLRPRSRSRGSWLAWGAATSFLATGCSSVAYIGRIITLTRSTRPIASNVSIGPEWTSIEPWLPLRPERSAQSIWIDFPAGQLGPSPTTDLQVEVIDEAGNAYLLGWPFFSSTPGVGLMAPDLGNHRINRVHLRSKLAFRALQITWLCWDPK